MAVGSDQVMTDYLMELRDSARQVIAGAGTPADEDTIWPLLVDLGWLLAPVPESLGGLGLGVQSALTLHAELGGGLSQAAFLPANLSLDAVCHSELPEPEKQNPALRRGFSGELASLSKVLLYRCRALSQCDASLQVAFARPRR